MEIDLRSDTVTQPTDEMRRAMAEAIVGDDVMGEDPTVNTLEAKSAEITGKEAALFVPSGTMGNLIAVLTHCQRGDEMILGDKAHIFLFEAGGSAALGGVHPHIVPNADDGTLPLELVESAIRPSGNPHYPCTKLIAIENTHNRCNGAALDTPYLWDLANLARQHNLKVHMDGARIFNAAVYLNKTVKEIAEPADSLMFCLSKGLSAPVGSMLCGSADFISRARRQRKQLGGGMRQAGVLAAAGLVAMEQIVPLLRQDMEHANLLKEMLLEADGLSVEPVQSVTNMVYINLEDGRGTAPEFTEKLKQQYEVKVGAVSQRRIRMVLHHWITKEQVRYTAQSIIKLLNIP